MEDARDSVVWLSDFLNEIQLFHLTYAKYKYLKEPDDLLIGTKKTSTE